LRSQSSLFVLGVCAVAFTACGGSGAQTPGQNPTPSPTPVATASPTPVRTATPTPVATASPTPVGGGTPTPVSTATPTPVATASPTPVATPTASATPAVTLTITGLPPGPLAEYETYQIGATESEGGSPVTPGALTIALDNPAIGKITGTTLRAGFSNATGHLTVTDSSHNTSETVAVTVNSTLPNSAGDTESFAGTIVETIARPQPVQDAKQSHRAPDATQPTYTYNYTVAISTVKSEGKTFEGEGGENETKSVETDTQQSPVVAYTITTDEYGTFSTANQLLDILTKGSSASDSNGADYLTHINDGNGIIDVLPESNQTWTDTAQDTYSETDPDGTTITRTDNQDGSYAEREKFSDPSLSNQVIDVNSDLSGSIEELNGENTSVSVGSPSGGEIAYDLTVDGTTHDFQVGDWYPSTTLASDTSVESLGVTIPTACNVPSVVGTTATKIDETYERLDPVLGTYEKRVYTNFLAKSYGLVCATIGETLDDYYDYSGQSPNFVELYDTPEQITTISETIGVVHADIAGAPHTFSTNQELATAKTSFAHVMARIYEARARQRAAALQRYRTATLKGVHR